MTDTQPGFFIDTSSANTGHAVSYITDALSLIMRTQASIDKAIHYLSFMEDMDKALIERKILSPEAEDAMALTRREREDVITALSVCSGRIAKIKREKVQTLAEIEDRVEKREGKGSPKKKHSFSMKDSLPPAPDASFPMTPAMMRHAAKKMKRPGPPVSSESKPKDFESQK